MPAPLAKGLIVLAVVAAAAGAAAYENPQIREWVENSRKKIAHALYSLGDEVDPRTKGPKRNDASMKEDEAEAAEERRRRARAEIMEKGRIMEARRRRKQNVKDAPSPAGSFDTLVDKDGTLKTKISAEDTYATTTAVDPEPITKRLTGRHANSSAAKPLHQSVDAPLPLGRLSSHPRQDPQDPFETQYEREMHNTWRLPLPNVSPPASSAHESESLIDLTPKSEFPDPDVVVPTITSSYGQSLDQTDYFFMASNSSHTLSEAAPISPPIFSPAPAQPLSQHQQWSFMQNSPTPSLASSIDHINRSDAESLVTDDGVLSEFGDGVRTPASGWTDVGSVASSDAEQ